MIVHNAVLSPLSPFLLANSASAEKRRKSKETEALRSGNALLPVRSKKGGHTGVALQRQWQQKHLFRKDDKPCALPLSPSLPDCYAIICRQHCFWETIA